MKSEIFEKLDELANQIYEVSSYAEDNISDAIDSLNFRRWAIADIKNDLNLIRNGETMRPQTAVKVIERLDVMEELCNRMQDTLDNMVATLDEMKTDWDLVDADCSNLPYDEEDEENE